MINSGIIEFYRSVVKDSCDVLSSGTSTRVNGEERTKKINYEISGRPTKRNCMWYIVLTCFISMFSFSFSWTFLTETGIFDNIISMLDTLGEQTRFVFGIIFIIINILSIILPIIIICVIIIKSRKYFSKIEPKPTNLDIYMRDLPSKLRPAHVRMFLNDGTIDKKTINSTLLDLIDKKFIKVIYVNSKQMLFIKTDKNDDELFKYEKFLLEWIFDFYGDGKEISNIELQNALNASDSKITSSEYFEYFQSLVLVSFPFNLYYNKTQNDDKKEKKISKAYKLSVLGSLFFLGGPFFAYAYGMDNLLNPRYILNSRGTDEKDKWEDLKKYLLEFSNIKEKNVEMVKIWEFYLTYSIALDISTFASNELEEVFGEEIYNSYSTVKNDKKEFFSNYLSSEDEEKIKKQVEIDTKSASEKYSKLLN